MELELKHLAPYLPYGLKCLYRGTPREVVGYNSEQGSLSVDLSISASCLAMLSRPDIVPLLHPLSTKLEKLLSEDDLEVTKCASRLRLIAMAKTNSLYQFQFEYLASKHFDVFGLIDAGLAIDIDSLNP